MGKIRIATKNFLCEKCNQLIKCGDRYADYWNVTLNNNYYHKRFHLECIKCKQDNSENSNAKKNDIFERIQKKLNDENGSLLASNKGTKCYICGIKYDDDGNKLILCETWNERFPYYETAENFRKNYWDAYGNPF